MAVPFAEVHKLYIMHLSFSLVSRMWDMGIVLFIAHITNNSLTLVAISGFLSSLSIFLFMPRIGKYLDTTDRMIAAKMALSVKIIVLSTAYVVCAYILNSNSSSNLVYILPLCCALASLSFSTINQSIEKDWLVVLSCGNSQWLANTNSVMSQIDLGCNSVGPVITGVLMSSFALTTCAIIFLLSNAIITGLLLMFMQDLYSAWPELASRFASTPAVVATPVTTTADYTPISDSEFETDDQRKVSSSSCLDRCSRWLPCIHDFVHSGCFSVMVSYAFLYFTVLSFGSLMTVYIRWCGLSDHWIGVARGAASLTGFLGASIFPALNARLGLQTTGNLAIWYQFSLVFIAASSFFWLDRHSSMIVVVVATVSLRYLCQSLPLHLCSYCPELGCGYSICVPDKWLRFV